MLFFGFYSELSKRYVLLSEWQMQKPDNDKTTLRL
jgi:hypothetical protein